MKWNRILQAAGFFIGLLVVVFLIANQLVGSGSTATIVDVARSKCIKDGFPAQTMIMQSCEMNNGNFGFGGHATVVLGRDGRSGPDGKITEFAPDGQRIPLVLHVELRRLMNLSEWEAISVVEGKGQ
jgi:hypothetical protein